MKAQGKNRLNPMPAALAPQVARYHIAAVCAVHDRINRRQRTVAPRYPAKFAGSPPKPTTIWATILTTT